MVESTPWIIPSWQLFYVWMREKAFSLDYETMERPEISEKYPILCTDKISRINLFLLSLLLIISGLQGKSLSGGEMQKLMLARALYKDAPVVILDEPTAALDPIAESEMYERYDAMIR